AENAKELSRAVYKLLNSPDPQVFDVLFRYDVSADGRQVDSAQLEFTPAAGKAPVSRTIVHRLSAPHVASSSVANPSVPGSSESSDKWTINLLSVNMDLRILLGMLLGGIALVLVLRALKNGKEPEESRAGHIEIVGVQMGNEEKQPRAQRARTSVGFAFPMPSQGRPAAVLRGVSGPARGRQYAIEQTTYRIGSDESNDLQLSDDYLSHKHASIKYDQGSLYLSDSGSRNGTSLNDVKLDQTARVLSPGDRIRVGKSTLELLAPNEDSGARKQGADGGGTRAW
ncbi:MAG TPA: FHA domain-containing protein, partial [Nitrosospira sp.]|nr:FHA domain-containing protein [Nitrosospira sp.]